MENILWCMHMRPMLLGSRQHLLVLINYCPLRPPPFLPRLSTGRYAMHMLCMASHTTDTIITRPPTEAASEVQSSSDQHEHDHREGGKEQDGLKSGANNACKRYISPNSHNKPNNMRNLSLHLMHKLVLQAMAIASKALQQS